MAPNRQTVAARAPQLQSLSYDECLLTDYMRIYALALVAVIAVTLTAVLTARRRPTPICPSCGARDSQKIIAERTTSGRNVMFAGRDWYGPRGEERLKGRREDVIDTTVKCSNCGTQYERSRIAERDVLG